jgi:antibiotic biosynthesis monooxygenase (ABM) superfamily enzyme
MMHFTVRCDIAPGQEEALDHFLAEKVKAFWLSQPGVKGFHVYADALVGWPERTIIIEVDDLASLQRVLDSEQRKLFRREFMTYTTNVQSQILDKLI